jgi:hypothetical protein
MRAHSIESRRAEARLNENNRKAYKLACLLRENGKTYADIVRELNGNGYKTATGKQWQIVQVQNLMALYK